MASALTLVGFMPGGPGTSAAEAAAPALPPGARQIPIGISGVANQVMNSRRYVYAIRFVLDRDTRVYRFVSAFNLEGALAVPGRSGYASGSGGRIQAQLVAVRRDGTPNMKRVLARETVSAVARFEQSRLLVQAPGKNQLLFFNARGVNLQGGRMYAMTYRNVARHPWRDWFSENSPTVKASEAGPNGRNNTNPRARGSIAGLEPREAVAWSQNGGRRWSWGRVVGAGPTRGAYEGSHSRDNGARLPWYGWQSERGGPLRSNQPYYAYGSSGSYTLMVGASPRTVDLTQAGGYAPVGESVGVVTVTNLKTGQVGRTGWLGSGIARGVLSPPVYVNAGDPYSIANTGTVFKAEGDSFLRNAFGLGRLLGQFPFLTLGQGEDRAELFALPHPFFQSG